ncbi:hypothetical protein [Psychroserpens mesophilus]|uniref:hypothetical protein n=1 Tax=Psychroserpens mesophilus TaxID=325473 RepID=UPI003F496574
MKKLLMFSIINTVGMLLLVASRIPSESEGIDWILIGGIILIIATWIHFFWERNKLNKLK